ncbi:superoxide dismutase family protein [Methylobacterium sp. C25]|uniref:superoxide dismutase family protein n=1 Tax=Methylobacterium sp. C25 TaxID=2721622 RepID=UPI001F2C77AC|nr:superoxide dismutase family protein [Methylobacterium sp. C25]MCE4225795.1 superoxide dismutase family protein [Methylobacterium sp. C25]
MRCIPAALVLAGLAMPALAQEKKDEAPATAVQTYESPITNNKGEPIGQIQIRDGANALVLRVTVKAGGLTPGWHGLHFHAVGDCSDTEKFEKSKAHVNHDKRSHGLLNGDGPDEGDLPNLFANADGSANGEMTSEMALTGEESLKDGDGSALIIHANEDDHASQPIGGAGARVACSVIK